MAGFATGDGTARAVTLTTETAPGISTPGGGLAVTAYCEAPAPAGPLIDHVKSAVPLFWTKNDCVGGAAPPQVARNVSDDWVTTGPPPIPLPESEMGAGSDPQMDPVNATIPMLPVTPLTVKGVNLAESA
jgi:hypothetical protein